MVTLTTRLNTTCTCTQCSTFLRTIPTLYPADKANRTKKPVLADSHSLFIAYHTCTSIWSPSMPSAYPLICKTPALLQCMHVSCFTRVPGTSYRDALCRRHRDKLRLSVRKVVESWAGTDGKKLGRADEAWRAKRSLRIVGVAQKVKSLVLYKMKKK
jgi:hypothetical protein